MLKRSVSPLGTKPRGRPRVPSLRSSCSCSSSSRGLVVSAAPRPVRLHHCPQRLGHCARTLRKARSPEARRPLGPAQHGVVRQGAWARGPRRPHVLVSAGERPGQLPETPNSLGAPALSGEGRGTSLTAELRPRLAARATPPPQTRGPRQISWNGGDGVRGDAQETGSRTQRHRGPTWSVSMRAAYEVALQGPARECYTTS